MSNPILNSIKSGGAPKPARLAAARGMLPLSQEEILHALIILRQDAEEDVRTAAENTLNVIDLKTILPIAQNPAIPAEVLGFLAVWQRITNEIAEAIILNQSTPDEAIARFASLTTNSNLMEAITINQQRMIRHPEIIDAILLNPYRSPEADRKAREVKVEFFEKELGAARVAEEQKARARLSQVLGADFSEEEFQTVITQVEEDLGVKADDEVTTTFLDPEAELRRFIKEAELEGEEVNEERMSIFQKISNLTVKERIFLGVKGNREARMILIRDSNKMVSSAVLKNPRITDAEIEMVAKLKSLNEEVLRLICRNRAWMSNYTILVNVTNNPRTPLTFTMTFINRLQPKDLKALVKNRGVPEVLRNMANRIVQQRQQQ